MKLSLSESFRKGVCKLSVKVRKYDKILEKITSNTDIIARFILFIILILMIVNVISRTFFNYPIKGVYDLASLLFTIVISLSIAYCAYNEGHVFVDFILEKFPIYIQKSINLFTNLISFLLFIFMSFSMFKYGYNTFLVGETSLTIMVPLYPFIYLIGIGLLLLSLVSLRNFLKLIYFN
jgi:TRAP-type C4-dicarboxylate transport system permease small subunit